MFLIEILMLISRCYSCVFKEIRFFKKVYLKTLTALVVWLKIKLFIIQWENYRLFLTMPIIRILK